MPVIDPTAALPLHFTLETIALSAAGLLTAWAVVRRRWIAASGAIVLTVVQGLHAGQFVGQEDEPALIASRLAALAAIALTVGPKDQRPTLLRSGVAAMLIGTVWGAIAGGSAQDLQIAPHLLVVGGAVAIIAWVWYATRPSVRLRVLAAFISVLAVVVVVAGGAVARVAAVDARNERYSKLGLESATMLRNVVTTRDVLIRRAATLSSQVAVGTSRRSVTIDRSRVLADEWLVVLDAEARRLASAEAEGVVPPYPVADLGSLEVTQRALGGRVSYATSVAAGALQLVATAPVYQPGSANKGSDVIGVVAVGETLQPTDLQTLAADATADVALIDTGSVVGTDADLATAARATTRDRSRTARFETIEGTRQAWLATVTSIPGGNAELVVAAPDDVVVDAATDLVKAFLVAILAAALLAVVAALWLSSRITRPMLQLADDAERVKSDFLASVSHELRTPLTPIRGYTEILRSRSVPAGDASGYLDEIGSAAQRLERIVSLLVDVASIEAGRFRVMLDEVGVTDLLTETAERWKERSPTKIQVRTARTLPAMLADAGAISRVLDELIDNALKFADNKDVELRGRRSGDAIEISVRDQGPGIDPERLNAVREAFHQADSGDTRRFGGLGLGLTFVEGVLDAHGSKLDIVSAPGEGTTCSFALAAAGSVGRMPPKAQMRKR